MSFDDKKQLRYGYVHRRLARGEIEFEPITYNVDRYDAEVTVYLVRRNGADGPAGVLVTSADGTAIEGLDYTSINVQILFDDGDNAGSLIVPILSNGEFTKENAVSFTLQLSEPYIATIGPNDTATITIWTALIQFNPTQYAVDINTNAVVNVERFESLESIPASVTWTTDAGTTGTLSWVSGDEVPQIITLDSYAESEASRIFHVTLTNPVNAILGNDVATIEINPVYITTPLYPTRPVDSLSTSLSIFSFKTTSWPVDNITVAGDVSSFNLQQVYFPVDYSYLQSGQTNTDYHEDITVAGDVLSFNLGTTYYPVDYSYLQAGQTSSNYHEDITVAGDVLSFNLETTYYPVDYINWPAENITVAGDVTSFTLGAP